MLRAARYCLYAARAEKLYCARIHHAPWPLRAATLETLTSTMDEAHGMKLGDKPALLHAQGEPLAVEVWPLTELRV